MREFGPLQALQHVRLHALQTGIDNGVAVSTPWQLLCIIKRLQYSVGIEDFNQDCCDHWTQFGSTATQAYQVLVGSFLGNAQLEQQQQLLRQQIKQAIGEGTVGGQLDLLHSDSEDSMCRSSSSDSDYGSSDDDDCGTTTGNATATTSNASRAGQHNTTSSSTSNCAAGSQHQGTTARARERQGLGGGGSSALPSSGAGAGAGAGPGHQRQGTVAGMSGSREDRMPEESWTWCSRRRRAMRQLDQLRKQTVEQLQRWAGSEALRRLERAEEELCAALGQVELGRAVAGLPLGGATAGAAAAGLEAAEARVATARAEFEDAWGAVRWLLEEVGRAVQQFADHHCMFKSRKILTVDRRRPGPHNGSGQQSSGHGEDPGKRCPGGIDWEALVRQAREEMQRSRSSNSNSRSGGGGWEEAVSKRFELLVREALLGDDGDDDDDAEVAALYGLVMLHAVQGMAPDWLLAPRRMATAAAVLVHCRTALAKALAPAYASRVLAAAAEEDAAARGGASGGGGGASGWSWSEGEWRQSVLDGRRKAASDVRRLFEWMQVTERLRRQQKATLVPTRCARHVARVRRLYERGRELDEQLGHTVNEVALAAALKAMEEEAAAKAAAAAAAATSGDAAAAEGGANKGRKKRKGKGKGGTKADAEAGAGAGDGEESETAAQRAPEAGQEEQAVDAPEVQAAAGGATPAAAAHEGPAPAQPAALRGENRSNLAPPAPAPAPPASAHTTANSNGTTAATTPARLPEVTAPAPGPGPFAPLPFPLRPQSRRIHDMLQLAQLSLVRDVLRRRQEQIDAAVDSVQVQGAQGTAVRIESLQQFHAVVEAKEVLPTQERATALLRLVAGRLLAAMARDAHATDTHEARVVTELHRLATHRRQLQEGHHQQQHHHQPQQEAQEQAQAGTHGGLPAAAGSSGGAADAASIKGLYFALEVCDTRTERWGDEGRQRLAEVHAAVDYWGAMGITAGVSEWELFGPPLGSRGLAGQVQLGGAGEEAAEHAGEGGAGGSGGSRVGALAVPSLLEERMEAKRAWRRTFDVELEQRIQRRWPVAALGSPAMALVLGRMAMMYGSMHAWLPYALMPPPLVDYLPGDAPAARWGEETTDLYRPRPGVPGCVLLVPLGKPRQQVVMPRRAALQPDEQDWSFDRLLGAVRSSFHTHHGASVMCNSMEKLQTVVLVFAKLHDELAHTSAHIACVATLDGSKPTSPFTSGDAAACGAAVKQYGMRLSVAKLSEAWGGKLTMHPACQPSSRDGG